jgi:hypothetical protein
MGDLGIGVKTIKKRIYGKLFGKEWSGFKQTQHKVQSWAVVNTIMDLGVP